MSTPAFVSPGPRRAIRHGWSLPETLVALLLGLVLVHLGLDSLTRLDAARRRMAARAEALVALRVSRHVLRRELRHGLRGEDWELVADSLRLRAFRGAGLVCASDSTGPGIVVAYEGSRAPDPSKDSVLLLTAAGGREARALAAAAPYPPPCFRGDSRPAQTWRLDRPAPPDVLAARVFERGSYHLSQAALRYRRGASGRQPLTPEVWSSATRWSAAGARLGVELVPSDSLAGAPWVGLLSWSP